MNIVNTDLVNSCDLCSNTKYTEIWNKEERSKKGLVTSPVIEHDGKIINGTSVMCEKCGLVFINPRMTEATTKKYYSTDYRETYKLDILGEEHHASMATDFMTRYAEIFTQYASSSHMTKALDIGCSTGKFMEKLKGYSTYGIDQCKAAIEIATSKKLRVTNSKITDFAHSTYGLVTIFNTLEHIHSPTRTLNEIHEILNDNGLIFIIVPDFNNNNTMISADGFMSNAHLYQFDIITLKLYLDKAGFDVVLYESVREFNMDKLYIVAKKSTPKLIRIKHKPDAKQKQVRLQSIHNLWAINHFVKKDMKKYEQGRSIQL